MVSPVFMTTKEIIKEEAKRRDLRTCSTVYKYQEEHYAFLQEKWVLLSYHEEEMNKLREEIQQLKN